MIYELNRAICNIQLGASFELIKRDLDKVLRLGPENGRWVRCPHPRKGRAVIAWLRQHEPELQDWIRENGIELPPAESEP